jgi:hypothetical protein
MVSHLQSLSVKCGVDWPLSSIGSGPMLGHHSVPMLALSACTAVPALLESGGRRVKDPLSRPQAVVKYYHNVPIVGVTFIYPAICSKCQNPRTSRAAAGLSGPPDCHSHPAFLLKLQSPLRPRLNIPCLLLITPPYLSLTCPWCYLSCAAALVRC